MTLFLSGGSLQPHANEDRQVFQIYLVGNYHEQASRRNSISQGIDIQIKLHLQQMSHTRNTDVKYFKYALDTAYIPTFYIVINTDQGPRCDHQERYNVYDCEGSVAITHSNRHNIRGIVLGHGDNRL